MMMYSWTGTHAFWVVHLNDSDDQGSHSHYLLHYSPGLWSLDFLNSQDRALFYSHQKPNMDSDDKITSWIWFSTISCGNFVSRCICNSVRRNAGGKASIFIATSPCWPLKLYRRSQQDAQVAISASDQSRSLNICWQSTVSSCPIGSPIKFEIGSHMAGVPTSDPNSSLNIAAHGLIEQQW